MGSWYDYKEINIVTSSLRGRRNELQAADRT